MEERLIYESEAIIIDRVNRKPGQPRREGKGAAD